ncbi:unnamed protein product, partial [Staurois parvus]
RSQAPRRGGGRRTPRRSGGRGPPGERQVSGPPGEAAGTESPGTTVGSESTGMTAGTGSDIGSSGWTAGIGVTSIRSFGSTAGTASSGKAVGSESTGMTAGTRADIESSGWTAGIGSTRHQVIWLDSGAPHHLARQCGTESPGTTTAGFPGVNWDWTAGNRVIRYRIVLARPRVIGSPGIRSFLDLPQRSPRHLARQWGPGSPG